MPAQLHKAREIFLHAVGKLPPEQWNGYVAEACAGDAALEQQVRQLLRVHSESGFLDRPATAVGATKAFVPKPGNETATVREYAGTVIGPYKLLQQIGEGGMGTVYMAEQTRPIQRKVALKIIKAGMDSKQVIARFEAERQALAMMDHVNIARVLDAGTIPVGSRQLAVSSQEKPSGSLPTADCLLPTEGRPYFVMELVHGVPITKYCDDNRLTPRQRLELFVPVCQAIQHAHQKGIIHRDIKPSNVMVTLYDGKPVPKVIDFGVAKAIEQKLTERTLFTQYGTMVGTLEYMSPEQAETSALGADTRSDIFSLGVLLYELLTGSTPLTQKRLKEAAYGEILRMIREEEAPKPSTRLSDSGAALAAISAQRHTEPAKLAKLMRGELDWIVMKTLEKDRNRRYETANGLARDIDRYLCDEAVEACPPTARYRLGKFARRHKAAFLVTAAFAGLLVVGVVVSTWQAVRATLAENTARTAERAVSDERDRAVLAEANTRTERDKVLAEKERADEEASIAKAVNDFLQDDLLAEAAPERNARGKKVTVEEVLGRAAARIAGKFEKQPRIEAAIRQTIGDTYRALGDYPAAQPHLERSLELRRRLLGEEHAETLTSKNNLALLYLLQAQYAKAEPLFVQALEVRRCVLGEEHTDTLTILNNLAGLYEAQGQFPKAESLYAKTLGIGRRVLGEEQPNTLKFMNNLALLHVRQAQYAKAEPLFDQVLEVRNRVPGPEHPDTLTVSNNLAGLYEAQGKFAKAESLYVDTLEVSRRVLGEEHPDTLTIMNNLAGLYQARGQFPKAEPLFVQTLESSRRVLGEEHARTLKSMNNLALLYQAQGQLPKAEPLFVQTLDVRSRVLGEEHPDTLISMNNLASLYQDRNLYPKAELLFDKALDAGRRVLGEEHPNTLSIMNNLAVLYQNRRQYTRAEPLHVKTLEVRLRLLGEEHPNTLKSMNNLAFLYMGQDQLSKAEPLFLKSLQARRRVLGEEHPDTLVSMTGLAMLYQCLSQYSKAEPLLREALEKTRKRLGEALPVAGALQLLGQNLLLQKMHAEAEPVLRECLTLRAKQQPDAWSTFNTQSMLGGSLLGQKKYAEAEPQLLAGYEGLKQRESRIPAAGKDRLTESLERLVQLYEATGPKDKAAEWRKRQEQPTRPVKP